MSDLQNSKNAFNPVFNQFQIPSLSNQDAISELPQPSLISPIYQFPIEKLQQPDFIQFNHQNSNSPNIPQSKISNQTNLDKSKLIDILELNPFMQNSSNEVKIVDKDNQNLLSCFIKSNVKFMNKFIEKMQNITYFQAKSFSNKIEKWEVKEKSNKLNSCWISFKENCLILEIFLLICQLLLFQNCLYQNVLRLLSIMIEFDENKFSLLLLIIWVVEVITSQLMNLDALIISSSLFLILLQNLVCYKLKFFIFSQKNQFIDLWFKIKIHIFTCLYQQLNQSILNISISYMDSIMKISFLHQSQDNQQLDQLIYMMYLYYIVEILHFLCFSIPEFQKLGSYASTPFIVHSQLKTIVGKCITSPTVKNIIKKHIEQGILIDYNFTDALKNQTLCLIPPLLQKQIIGETRLPYLLKIQFLNELFSNQFIKNLSNNIQEFQIQPGVDIFSIFEPGSIILIDGSITIQTISGFHLGRLTKGKMYGQELLFNSMNDKISLITSTFCKILLISKSHFKECLNNFKRDKYFMLLEQEEQIKIDRLHLKCVVCEGNHLTMKCKKISYQPNIERVEQNRKQFDRQLKRHKKPILQLFILQTKLRALLKKLSQTYSQATSQMIEQISSSHQNKSQKLNEEQSASFADFIDFQQNHLNDQQQGNMSENDKNSDMVGNSLLSRQKQIISKGQLAIRQKVKDEQILDSPSILLNPLMSQRLSQSQIGIEQKLLKNQELNPENQDNEYSSLRQIILSQLSNTPISNSNPKLHSNTNFPSALNINLNQSQIPNSNINNNGNDNEIQSNTTSSYKSNDEEIAQFKFVSSKGLTDKYPNFKYKDGKSSENEPQSQFSYNQPSIEQDYQVKQQSFSRINEWNSQQKQKDLVDFERMEEYGHFFRNGNAIEVIEDCNKMRLQKQKFKTKYSIFQKYSNEGKIQIKKVE